MSSILFTFEKCQVSGLFALVVRFMRFFFSMFVVTFSGSLLAKLYHHNCFISIAMKKTSVMNPAQAQCVSICFLPLFCFQRKLLIGTTSQQLWDVVWMNWADCGIITMIDFFCVVFFVLFCSSSQFVTNLGFSVSQL